MPYVVQGDLLCHIWTGYCSSNGTPVIRTPEGQTTVRRRNWERVHGPVPEGKQLGAWCRNRLCVRERHAVPMTPAEIAEMMGTTVLSPHEGTRALLMRKHGISQREVGRRLGVSAETIKAIEDGTHWSVRKGAMHGT